VQLDTTVVAALITASGVITGALIERVRWTVSRVDDKIEGLSNGRRHQALAVIEELRRERAERELRGLPPRRRLDQMVEEETE
jgi:hypothetical protein